MRDLNRLRALAETLASELPEYSLLAQQQATAAPGASPRKRSGHGEDFWQYRGRTPEDSSSSIDWRRSATGDELYIREHELQTARQMEIWLDPSAGFDWTGSDDRLTKADEARVMLLGLAKRFADEGDRVGVLGGAKAPSANNVLPNILEDFELPNRAAHPPVPRRESSLLLIVSDFYTGLDEMSRFAHSAAANGQMGVLLQICDPMEVEFPFTGRVRFSRPGGTLSRIFGRTEGLKEAYDKRFKARQDAVRDLAARIGWGFEAHMTGAERRPSAYRVMQSLITSGGAV